MRDGTIAGGEKKVKRKEGLFKVSRLSITYPDGNDSADSGELTHCRRKEKSSVLSVWEVASCECETFSRS